MKNVLIKNSLKSIKTTYRRFLSILLMAMLGVGFFSGLVSSAPDMQQSLDKYLDETNTYDIDIVSTLGLTQEDIKSLEEIEDVDQVYGVKSRDTMIKIQSERFAAKVIEYSNEINAPVIVDGRGIENENECLVNKSFMEASEYQINDKIILEDDENFKNKEFTIVGVVQSPMYIGISGNNIGTTSLGKGTLDLYLYIDSENFDFDYYTDIYVNVKDAKNLETNSEEYKRIVQNATDKIEEIKDERELARYNEIKGEAENKLKDAQEEYDKAKKEAEDKIADGETELENSKKEVKENEEKIETSEKEIEENERKTNLKFAQAEKQIKNAKTQIAKNEETLATSKQEFEAKKEEANAGIAQIEAGIKEAKQSLGQLEDTKSQLEKAGQDTTQIDNQIIECQKKIDELENQKKQIESELKQGENQILEAEDKIANAKEELQKSKDSLATNKKQTNTKIANAKAELNNAKKKIEEAKKEIEKGEKELEEKKKEAEDKLANGQKEIDDATREVEKIEKAVWYILDREDNNGYSTLIQSIDSIRNIAKVFPILFYIIAILISLNSMTRMVEEERIEIGTLKALGYKDSQIIFKYLLYSFLASLLGGIIGMFLTFKMIPAIIWNVYKILFYVPNFYTPFRAEYGILGLGIAVVCICGATLFSTISELRNMPSVLMRPKPPKNGKRVFLERITIIWKRLKFSHKITIRNLFRYKKRVLMTVIGIAGCTALITAGLGLRDSITGVVKAQFEEIFTYDVAITLKDEKNVDDLDKVLSEYQEIEDESKINMQTGYLKHDENEKEIRVFVPENSDEIDSAVNLYDANTNEKVNLTNDGIVITEKLAELINVKIGDVVSFRDNDNLEYELKVNNIVKNYVDNYVFMSKDLYEEKIGSYESNMVLFKVNENIDSYKSELSERILENKSVSSVNFITETIESLENMLQSLNYVVAILIISSAILAFVVLYNLANINISERKREIATLKVLGFYNNEVDSYINKEGIILTALGITIGLALGFVLNDFLISTCEIERMRFIKQVHLISYVISSLMTIAFTIIVNWIIHFHLKKVDMIESLKSVE